MAITSHMNIVLGQGDAVKDIHNLRRQHLDLNQQAVAQEIEDKKEKDKSKVQEFDTGNNIEIKDDEEKKNKEDSKNSKDNKKDSEKERIMEGSPLSEGRIVDIKV